MANSTKTQITKKKASNKIVMPRWAMFVVTTIIVVAGIFLVYDSLAIQGRNTGGGNSGGNSGVTILPNGVRQVTYNGRVLFKKRSLACSGGFKYKYQSGPESDRWRCAGGAAVAGGGNYEADKLYIYNRESGNNPAAVNSSSGACGLGQFLPCNKIQPCTLNEAGRGCQDGKFTAYMQARYGTWSAARAFWDSHNWW